MCVPGSVANKVPQKMGRKKVRTKVTSLNAVILKNLQKVELYTFALLLFSILFIEVVWCSFRFQNALNLLLCSLLGERCKQTCIGISAYILSDELYLFFGKNMPYFCIKFFCLFYFRFSL